jgi:hypothetical protein
VTIDFWRGGIEPLTSGVRNDLACEALDPTVSRTV